MHPTINPGTPAPGRFRLAARSGRLLLSSGLLLGLLLPALLPPGGGAEHAAAAETARDQPLAGKALVRVLRRGGYVIYFRHAQTDWSQDDRVSGVGDWTSCDGRKIRQLSAAGRETARRIGAAIRRLGIPVGRVLSSEYCRAADTARLMGLGKVVTTRRLMNMRVAHLMGGDEAVAARARRLIAESAPKGANTVMAAHGNLMRAATGHYVGEAGAGVFKPDGKGGFTFVAEVTPDQWGEWARRFGTRKQ